MMLPPSVREWESSIIQTWVTLCQLHPVSCIVMHLIHCYRCSLETSTSSWTVCLWICRIVLRVWEGFPSGPALTDRDMAFQLSHWAPLLSLLLAGHHRPDPCCRNSCFILVGWNVSLSPNVHITRSAQIQAQAEIGSSWTKPRKEKIHVEQAQAVSHRDWVGQAAVVLYATAHSRV